MSTYSNLLQKESNVECNNSLLNDVQCSSIVLGWQLTKNVGAIVLTSKLMLQH